MKPIIHLKEGLLGNVAAILFMLGLSAFVLWIDKRINGEVHTWTWILPSVWVLVCYFPYRNIRNPKSRTLLIDGDRLVWRVRDSEGGSVREQRIPLRTIRSLQFVIPADGEVPGSHLPQCAELYFVTTQGKRHLPLDFFPGVYRERIIAGVREHLPDVQVEDVQSAD
jgi:hypothetical protein